MKALGLNPGEQEMIDMTNEVNINGLIYYPDFCKLVLRKYREENRETLNQALFKVIIFPKLPKCLKLYLKYDVIHAFPSSIHCKNCEGEEGKATYCNFLKVILTVVLYLCDYVFSPHLLHIYFLY